MSAMISTNGVAFFCDSVKRFSGSITRYRLFKTAVSLSVTARRLAYSVTNAMLADQTYTSYTVLNIAMESGFNSKSAFNKIFNQSTDLTPTKYRKKTD